MADSNPTPEVDVTPKVDVTKEWRATQEQGAAAKRLRIFAGLAWVVAIGTEIAAIVMLKKHMFDHGNMVDL